MCRKGVRAERDGLGTRPCSVGRSVGCRLRIDGFEGKGISIHPRATTHTSNLNQSEDDVRLYAVLL